MKRFVPIVFLSFAVALVCAQSPDAGTCSLVDVDTYTANNLDMTCRDSLNFALYANVSSPGKDTQLDAICTDECAGKLANWLERECGGTLNATSLYYSCLQTSGIASVGRYCRYAIPPVFNTDAEIFNVFIACTNVFSTGQCTDQCALVLTSFSQKLGCCYQSLYNNSVYYEKASAIGELAPSDVTKLQMLGNLTLWVNLCQVTPPGVCTTESFAFPTSEGVNVLPHLQVLTVLVILAFAISYF